jgi:hypothetical protein
MILHLCCCYFLWGYDVPMGSMFLDMGRHCVFSLIFRILYNNTSFIVNGIWMNGIEFILRFFYRGVVYSAKGVFDIDRGQDKIGF